MFYATGTAYLSAVSILRPRLIFVLATIENRDKLCACRQQFAAETSMGVGRGSMVPIVLVLVVVIPGRPSSRRSSSYSYRLLRPRIRSFKELQAASSTSMKSGHVWTEKGRQPLPIKGAVALAGVAVLFSGLIWLQIGLKRIAWAPLHHLSDILCWRGDGCPGKQLPSESRESRMLLFNV